MSNEAELTTVNYEEENEPILPDGWSEGDDFFADPKTWSGASDASGQTTDEPSELESIRAEMGSEEALTTGEAEDASGQSAEEETEDPASGQTEEPAKTSRILKLKVNHQDQEVDINSMSDEELISALQKSRAFDAMKEDQNKARYREIYQDQIDAGMTEAAARMIAANECGGKTYALTDDSTPAPAADPTPVPAPKVPAPAHARDLAQEIKQLKQLYPDFKETPDEVAIAYAAGTDLLTAYVAYREKQTSKAAASLKRENEVLKQNAASAARAPVKGVTGGGATDTKPKNHLLVGFDSDDW
jgi:hypothetical protein